MFSCPLYDVISSLTPISNPFSALPGCMRRRREAIRLQETLAILLEREQLAHEEDQASRVGKRKAKRDPDGPVQAWAVC